MKVVLVPSSVSGGGAEQSQFSTTFLINDTVAIDAGALGCYRSAQEQARVKHVLISHPHQDHIATLPIFLENVCAPHSDCVTVHGSEPTLQCLRQDVFNDRVWPDLIRLASPAAPFLKLFTLEAHRAIELEGLRITPVPVHHSVPTLGFLVQDESASVIFSSDTGPTEELWRLANQAPALQAVFIEACFPNHLQWLADRTGHLTPSTLAHELRKLTRPTRLIAVHLKPRHRLQIIDELRALHLPNLEIGAIGTPYEFGDG